MSMHEQVDLCLNEMVSRVRMDPMTCLTGRHIGPTTQQLIVGGLSAALRICKRNSKYIWMLISSHLSVNFCGRYMLQAEPLQIHVYCTK